MDIGDYILQRLSQLGIKSVFGVPGDFVFGICDKIVEKGSPVEWVGTCNELNAGYAGV